MKTMLALLILLTLIGCGNTSHTIETDIPDTIEVIHTIDLEDFRQSFINECEEQFDTEVEIEICVNEKIADLLDFLNGNNQQE